MHIRRTLSLSSLTSRPAWRLGALLTLLVAALAFLPATAQAQSHSLTATVNSDRSVDLTLSNAPGNWYFRIGSGSCTAVTGSSVNGISGYKAGTYSVKAYSDSNCGSQIAATTFTIPSVSLTATVNSDRSVDLTLTNGPSNWYFRIDSGSCTAVSGSTVSGISGYKAGYHEVAAFANAGCTGVLADTWFNIPNPPQSNASLTTRVNTDRSVNLTLTNGPSNNNWWFRINWWGTCTAVTGSDTVSNIQGYRTGTHSVTAYSDSGCYTEIASSSFTIPHPAVLFTTVNNDRSVDIRLSGGLTNWWFKIGWWGDCTQVSNSTTVSNIRGYQSGWYIVAAYQAAGCAKGTHIALKSFTIPTATLTATVNSDRSVDLNLSNGPSNWWFRINWWGSCTAASGNTVSNIAGYKDGDHAVAAYSDSGCNYHVAATTFTLTTPAPTTPSLTATNITGTGATLNMTGYTSAWSYKRTAGPADTTCSDISSGTTTATLSSLTADTLYGYTSYSGSGCTTANKLYTVHFSTTDYGVGNLDEAASGVSCSFGANGGYSSLCAVAFTTGAQSGGYTLVSITGDFAAKTGSPGNITVAIHAADSNNSSNPASSATVTLSGSNPDTAGLHTYTCSGASCALSANTTYFVVLSMPGTAGFNTYNLRATTSGSETAHPATNGWSIADSGRNKSGSNAWGSTGSYVPMLHIAADDVIF